MVQRFCNHSALLIVGAFVGLVLTSLWGGGLWGGSPWRSGNRQGVMVDASATQGEDNFSIATGMIGNGIEGLYFLDYLTGDLRAVVLNRRTAKFSGFYQYNIQNDFNVSGSKNPKFLMVTGQVEVPRGRGPTQIGNSAIYIAEATTGQVNAYAIEWSSAKYAAGKIDQGTFTLLDGEQLRTTFVRDQ
jgi:hypothetical protein